MLGYSVPSNNRDTAQTLTNIKYEYAVEIGNKLKHELEFITNLIDKLSNDVVFSTCNICENEHSSYNDIPRGWGWVHVEDRYYMMCNDCQEKYTDKYNKLPKIITEI